MILNHYIMILIIIFFPEIIHPNLTQSNVSPNDLLLNFDKPNSVLIWREINSDEVMNIVNCLKNAHSKDFYDMSNCFVKQIISVYINSTDIGY